MKPPGLVAATQALRYWERRQEVVSNNLANADTTGFKGERVFASLLQGSQGSVVAPQRATDYRSGALTTTDAPLDLALEGDGFFVVRTPAGERLTRGGSFRLDANGMVTDLEGNALLGDGGPITVPPGKIEIRKDGVVRVEGKEVGRLRVETVPPGTQLQHDAGTRFLPDPTRTAMDPAARRVRQGTLEASNVDSVGSLVDLINIQRSYAAVQSTVKTFDGVMGTIANEIGKVG
jgi:flagellar basal body rod protein FlgG